MPDNRESYLSHLGDVTMMNQDSLSFGILTTKTFSNPTKKTVPSGRTHVENVVCEDIKSVFFLNKELELARGGGRRA